jgi:hypothetical protein
MSSNASITRQQLADGDERSKMERWIKLADDAKPMSQQTELKALNEAANFAKILLSQGHSDASREYFCSLHARIDELHFEVGECI